MDRSHQEATAHLLREIGREALEERWGGEDAAWQLREGGCRSSCDTRLLRPSIILNYLLRLSIILRYLLHPSIILYHLLRPSIILH